MLRIQPASLKPFYEIHLWLDDGNYWTTLNLNDSGSKKTFDWLIAERLLKRAEETYGPDAMLRIVKYTPELYKPTDEI